jgi:DNA-binding LytR/AlgR family response regulator
MINCIAIDDEPLALEIIGAFCLKAPFLNLQKTFTDTKEAARFMRKFPVDLLFLDIQMPDRTGIEFYRQEAQGKMVIFTTAFSDYAVEGFNLNALDYLLKPIEQDRFMQAVNKANDYLNYLNSAGNKENEFLFVRSEYSLVKIPFCDIDYIETLDDYIKIHTRGKKPLLTKMNLKNVMAKLNPNKFVRVHRSYVVPFDKILSVRGKLIKLADIEIPIGVKFEEEFFKKYSS